MPKTRIAAPMPVRNWLASPRPSCALEKAPFARTGDAAYRWRGLLSALRRSRAARRLGAALLACLCAARPSRAAFQNPIVGARAAAMGGSALAAEGGSEALLQAPAAPASLTASELYLQYQQLNAGLQGTGTIGQGLVTGAVKTKLGVLGVGLSDFRASGLMEERVLGLGLAGRATPWLDLGVAAKYLYHDFSTSGDALASGDPVFRDGSSRGAFALDLGAAAQVAPEWRLGLSVRNLNSPDVGLDSPDRVARETQAGVAWYRKAWDLKATADFLYRDNGLGRFEDRASPSVGLEKGFEDGKVRFRAGASLDQFTAGVGIAFGNFGFDYAFILSRRLVADNAGTHLVGIRYRFGGEAR